MSNYSKCEKGHFYPRTLPDCPFCAKGEVGVQSDRTERVDDVNVGKVEKTQRVTPSPKAASDKVRAESSSNTKKVQSKEKVAPVREERTVIHRASTKGEVDGKDSGSRRRLEGWLVSFTIETSGVDFRLYEGKNVIGRDGDSDVRIINDPKVSARHALIVFRGDETVFVDEMSSNKSYINDEPVGLGARVPLLDGAKIKMGDNEFFFRKVKP